MRTSHNALDPNHPADAAMLREQAGSQMPVPMSGSELASMAKMSPADLVASLANSDVEVPADSPIRKMSSDELRTAMQQGIRAVNDFRKSQDQMNYMEQVTASAQLNPSNRNVGNAIRSMENAEKLNAASAHSAARLGMDQGEYDAAVRELANVMNPSDPTRKMREQFEQEQRNRDLASMAAVAPEAESNEAKLNDLGGGQFELLYPTGERFLGTPQEIQEKVIRAGVETKKWARGLNAENKQLRQQLAALQTGQTPGNPVPETPQPTWEQAGQMPNESSKWVLDNLFAKPLGYADSNELIQEFQGLKQKVQQQDALLTQYKDEREVMLFHAKHPEFPATNEASDVLVKLIDSNGLEFNADNMELAHSLAVQKGFYRPLSPQEIAVANGERSAVPGVRVPPRPPQGNAPSGNDNMNPWAMSKDELRRRVLEGGGLGKALLDLKPGEQLGG